MREVKIGKHYKHFKGNIYEVIALAKNTETLKDMVVYKDDLKTWVRDYDMFNSLVDNDKYPNIKQKYRFEEIDD